MSRRLPFVCLLIGALFFGPVCNAALFTDVIAFGDSLSDNGNVFTLTRGTIPDTTEYYEGRFSNGPVWAEYLAADLGLSGHLQDFAYGGARTDSVIPPGLKQQVEFFLETFEVPEQALFTVWIGANDLWQESPDVAESVQNVMNALAMLASAGAEYFLIPNMPNLGATPKWNGAPDTTGKGLEISVAYNQALEDGLKAFMEDNPGVTVYAVDVFGLFEALMADYDAWGFVNVAEACPNFGVNFDGDGYLFWDEVHPTTQGHELMAMEAASLIRAASDPMPDIKANGSDERITVTPGTVVTVTVNLDPGRLSGKISDVWIVAAAPFGVYSYQVPYRGWEEGIHAGLPSPLPETWSSMEVLNRTLTPGEYTFYFALDDSADGLPDAEWLDSVQVTVNEGS